jgi:predicted RNase H-like HicB family nuclease
MNKDLKYYLSLPYKTVLEYEPDDKTWVAYCPDLGRGTCYAIGESKFEALRLLEESKKIILEYALSEGKEIPESLIANLKQI